jgi:hypothetical protein
VSAESFSNLQSSAILYSAKKIFSKQTIEGFFFLNGHQILIFTAGDAYCYKDSHTRHVSGMLAHAVKAHAVHAYVMHSCVMQNLAMPLCFCVRVNSNMSTVTMGSKPA